MSDEQLIEKISKGESQLYEQIVRKYNQRLFRVARAILKNDADAEDVLQETYLKAYLALSKFEKKSQFSTWITRILINNANETLRKRKRESPASGFSSMPDLPEAEPDHDRPDKLFSNSELKKVLEEAIDQLPETLRAVYILREIEGLSVAESASCLNISEENVKTRVHRAKAFLKEELYRRSKGDIDVFRFGSEKCDRMTASVMMQIGRFN